MVRLKPDPTSDGPPEGGHYGARRRRSSGHDPINTGMGQPFKLIAGDRLQIREGGGCMSVFGLPFFGAGVFMSLTVGGVVPMGNAGELPALAWPVLALMAIAFTAVGGALVFGRSWTTIDRAQRGVIKQWGLIVPLHERASSLDGYSAIRLDFAQGDSDTADRFTIALKAPGAPDLRLCSFTAYAQARECARAIAEYLRLEVEDASTDHPVRLSANQIDAPLRERQRGDLLHSDADRPANARSQVMRENGRVTITIPSRPLSGLVLAAALVPIAIVLAIGPPFATFFRESRTPEPVGWAFLGFLTLFFGILPTMTIVNGFLRSRRGATIVEASTQGLRVSERGAWRTRAVASLDAADILDVDYSSRESSIASATRAAEQQVLQSYPSADSTINPRLERMLAALARFARNKGVIVKTRTGLTTFGAGLDDAEVRYLHSVVRRALIE